MSPERWQKVDEVFAGTEGLSNAALESYLVRECSGDAELRQEVESLLIHADEKGVSTLQKMFTKAAEVLELTRTGLRIELAEKRIGSRIGYYQLERVLGYGGMGVVYLAARNDEQVSKLVALKLVQQGRDSKFIRDRFRQERQILASLEHPNIARFIDGGVTFDDLPYYVMEYVDDAQSIVDYCRMNHVALMDRLKLFLAVCSAVQYAHRNLVVHRDLKPSNILVSKDGTLKLLDFGIAKVLSADPETAKLQTMVRMLTPDYASPEQVHSSNITTATDTYSLGAVLYELLTDLPAHKFRNYSNTEIERVVCREDPLKPSDALLEGQATAEMVHRSRQLRGDLDSIVALAMRKEPELRYPSVQALMDDIGNFLEGRPVFAHKGTIRYRAGKYLRRYHIPIAAAAAVVVALLAGTATTVYQAQRAERRFQQVRQLASTLLNDFDRRIQSLPQSVELREWMATTVIQYLDNLAKEAGTDESLQRELAEGYYKVAQLQGQPSEANLGQSVPALDNYRKAMVIYSKLIQGKQKNGQILKELCFCAQNLGMVEAFSGNVSKAKEVLLQSKNYGQMLLELDPLMGHQCLSASNAGLFSVEMSMANPRGAIPFVNDQLEHARAVASKDSKPAAKEDLIAGTLNLATAYLASGNPDAALRGAMEAQQTGEMAFGKAVWAKHRLRFRVLDTMGDIYGNHRDINLQEDEKALAAYREALAMAEASYTRDPQDARYRRDVDRLLRKQALLLVDEHPGDAMSMAKRALDLSAINLQASPKNPEYIRDNADAWLIIGYAHEARKQYEDAISFFNRALKLQEDMERASPESRRFLREFEETHEATGNVLLRLDRDKEALENYERAEAVMVKLLWERPTDPYLLRDLSDAHQALGEYYRKQAHRGGPNEKANWRKAVEYQKKCLETWTDWERKIAPSPYAKMRVEGARKKLEGFMKAARL